MRIHWPIRVPILTSAGSLLLFATLKSLQDPDWATRVTISYTWAGILVSYLLLEVYFRTKSYNEIDVAPSALGTSRELLAVTAIPSIMVAVEGSAKIGGWGSLSHGHIVLISARIVLIGFLIVFLFKRFLTDFSNREKAFTASIWPSLSVATVIVMLGGPTHFAYLTWLARPAFFNSVIALRLTWLSAVAVIATTLIVAEICRLYSVRGLNFHGRPPSFQEISLNFPPDATLGVQVNEIIETAGSFLANLFELGWYVARVIWHIFFTTVIYAAISIVNVLKSYDLKIYAVTVCVSGLILSSVAFEANSIAVTDVLRRALFYPSYDGTVMLILASIFCWVGALSLIAATQRYQRPSRPVASFGVITLFALMGFWTSSVLLWIYTVLHGSSLTGYMGHGTSFIALFSGIWLFLWLRWIVRSSRRRTIALVLALIVTCLWLAAFPREMLWPQPIPQFMAGMDVSAVPAGLPSEPITSIAAEKGESPPQIGATEGPDSKTSEWPGSWILGDWNVGAGCISPLRIRGGGSTLQIGVDDQHPEVEAIIAASPDSVRTTDWAFLRRLRAVSASARGQSFELRPCRL